MTSDEKESYDNLRNDLKEYVDSFKKDSDKDILGQVTSDLFSIVVKHGFGKYGLVEAHRSKRYENVIIGTVRIKSFEQIYLFF